MMSRQVHSSSESRKYGLFRQYFGVDRGSAANDASAHLETCRPERNPQWRNKHPLSLKGEGESQYSEFAEHSGKYSAIDQMSVLSLSAVCRASNRLLTPPPPPPYIQPCRGILYRYLVSRATCTNHPVALKIMHLDKNTFTPTGSSRHITSYHRYKYEDLLGFDDGADRKIVSLLDRNNLLVSESLDG